MSETVEQRLKPTLIRRRAKKEEFPPPPPFVTTSPSTPEVIGAVRPPKVGAEGKEFVQPKVQGAAASLKPQEAAKSPLAAKPADAIKSQEAPKPPVLTVQELEEKFKRGARKKLSKAEMELEDIKRAGGLKHFVQVAVEDVVVPEVRERVFEPGPTRKRKIVKREFKKTRVTEPKAIKKVIRIAETISVSDLSQRMGIKASDLVKKLSNLGVMATLNQQIDVDTATLIATDYGYTIERAAFSEEDILTQDKKDRASQIIARPPVVTIMGHVDHGKTSLLDYIRKANVAAGEAGGITQHIGAYTVSTQKGKITFIDTPGHAAFTAMRARGAKVTDIVVLVVAADDGVMPQTKEAIDHARAAGVSLIVAVNKIDKPEANLERTKRSLSEYGIIPEDWGGDVIIAPTSARTGEGVDHLLDMILLQAEVMELKADAGSLAKGVVVESRLSKGRGPVATILIQEGSLKLGSSVVCGLYYGKIRSLISDRGEAAEFAGPSEPVEVVGLTGVPLAGDELIEITDERQAKLICETRQSRQRTNQLAKASRVTLEDLQKQIVEEGLKELSVVLKTDVHGSVEAIKEALFKQSTEKVRVKVVHAGVGAITESDVMLAAASSAIIVSFNVTMEPGVAAIAEREGVEIRRYSIIYELLDDIKKAMEGLLTPISVEKVIGHAEVLQVFNISKVGTIAGCVVRDGKIIRTAKARLTRDGGVVFEGKLSSLKHFKNDVKEVLEGFECGIGLENYNDVKVGDVFEAYIIEEIAQKL